MKLVKGCLISVVVLFILICGLSGLYYVAVVDDTTTASRSTTPRPTQPTPDPSPSTDTPELFSTDPKPQPEKPKREEVVASEFEIDNFQSEGFYDDIAYQIAELKLQGGELPQVDRRIGSVGLLKQSYEVISIANYDTLQVDLSSSGSFDLDMAFIKNIDTSQSVTGERRVINGPVMYTGVTHYTTILGAGKSAHTYEVLPASVSRRAEELVVLMRKKQATLNARQKEEERKRGVRVTQRQELLVLIARMRQNGRTLGDYDISIRQTIADNIGSRLIQFDVESHTVWEDDSGVEFRSIVEGLKETNAKYTQPDTDSEALVEALGKLQDRAEGLGPGREIHELR